MPSGRPSVIRIIYLRLLAQASGPSPARTSGRVALHNPLLPMQVQEHASDLAGASSRLDSHPTLTRSEMWH